MMNRSQESARAEALLVDLINFPEQAQKLKEAEWDLVLRMARSAQLLGRLSIQMEKLGFYPKLTEKVVDHLIAAQALVEQRQRMLLWEINRLQRCLMEIDIDVVVLKGCGYLLSELPVGEGRSFADVDIMVAKTDLARVESHLIEKGWQSEPLDDYDQRYYRNWMHEVPPLRHRDRAIEVDLHHTILPLTCRLQPNPELLFQNARELKGCRFKVLAPCDMLLHSATHLFYGSELNGDLRDLVDLADLFTYYSSMEKNFSHELGKRAVELDLQLPLFYALHFCHRLLGAPIPDFLLESCTKHAPSKLLFLMMDKLVPVAIMPEHPDFPSLVTPIARWFLYVRSHYLKMPLRLLIPHLFRKSFKRHSLISAMK